MSEEKLLPCIWCGSTNIRIAVYPFRQDFLGIMSCLGCKLQLPSIIMATREEIEQYFVSRWNALPRALHWEKEKPTTPGMYWIRIRDNKFSSVAYINTIPDGPYAGNMGCYIMGAQEDELLEAISKKAEWAGPIPMPEEG